MQFGICLLNFVALRKERNDRSEMVSQLLFGEHFEILENQSKWAYIKSAYDKYEGWIDQKQIEYISETEYLKLNSVIPHYSGELFDFLKINNLQLAILSLGATLPNYHPTLFTVNQNQFSYEGAVFNQQLPKKNLVNIGLMYLNTPYLWGGKTPFGIDCSGFTQMVYKLGGYYLHRDANQQAKQGLTLNFLEEAVAGDLAFFDNELGNIIHVGILMGKNQIIHASGKVRIDYIDHHGIFNSDTKTHTHKLRVIKRIIS